MFRTYIDNMIGVPGMFGKGQSQWHQVSRVIRKHWYHVTLQARLEDRTTEAVLMIDSEPQLQQILVAQDDELFVTDVQVVTPAYMNGSGSWRMETVTRVTLGEDENECVVCLLEVETGAMYHSSHQPDFDRGLLTNFTPIFHSDMIRSA